MTKLRKKFHQLFKYFPQAPPIFLFTEKQSKRSKEKVYRRLKFWNGLQNGKRFKWVFARLLLHVFFFFFFFFQVQMRIYRHLCLTFLIRLRLYLGVRKNNYFLTPLNNTPIQNPSAPAKFGPCGGKWQKCKTELWTLWMEVSTIDRKKRFRTEYLEALNQASVSYFF